MFVVAIALLSVGVIWAGDASQTAPPPPADQADSQQLPLSGPGTLRPIFVAAENSEACVVITIQVQLQPTREALKEFIGDAFLFRRNYCFRMLDSSLVHLERWWAATPTEQRQSAVLKAYLDKELPPLPPWIRVRRVGVIIVHKRAAPSEQA